MRAAWAPRLDRALILTRIAITVLMACGFWLYLAGVPLPWWLIAVLSVSLALAVAAVLLALEHLPAEDAGRVTSRGRR
jgi:heme A synthase